MNISALIVLGSLIFIDLTDALRYAPKGNARGVTLDYSSMSPSQAAILKHLIKQNCIEKYGRFASKFC